MKKNLILLVALFLMQMVSGVTPTKVPYFQIGNSLKSNIADSVKIGCDFYYMVNSTSTTSFELKVKKIGFFYRIGNKPTNVLDTLNRKNVTDSLVYLPKNISIDSIYTKDFNNVLPLINLLPKTNYRIRPFIVYDVINLTTYNLTVPKNVIVYGNEIQLKSRIARPIVNLTNKNYTYSVDKHYFVDVLYNISSDSISKCNIYFFNVLTNKITRTVYTSIPPIENLNKVVNSDRFILDDGKIYNVYCEVITSLGTFYSDTTTVSLAMAKNALGLSALKDNTETNFKVYPNPSNGRFNVSFDNSTPNNRIKLFDITGKLVYSTEIQNTNIEIDLTGKQLKGIYLLKVINDKGGMIGEKKLQLE